MAVGRWWLSTTPVLALPVRFIENLGLPAIAAR
ncbi:hypothetical protein SAMN05216201_11853 [Pseudomonas linyingensis]|uniref:Uncharacterized protein n=1 Tax=Pseudomonas linyingensis TaxID=915471 RepID=A0A1H7BYE5_9PSED|nr:hypothetical protein SAMN05216201_11853 [Pseudomonas linyingensis]